MQPIRVQRKRTKGWRMPENTVSVTRPGKWGNPYAGADYMKSLMLQNQINPVENSQLTNDKFYEFVVDAFKHFIESNPDYIEMAQKELKGKNLACFCALDRPCHADVLLEIANR